MQKINIPILGLTASGEARAMRDGECCVLHNMTVDSGGVKVVAKPAEGVEKNASEYREFYHARAKQWLSLNSGKVYNATGQQVNIVDKQSDGYVQSLEFMGNIVVMYCRDNSVRYAIYDAGYRYLGRLPELPRLGISVKPVHVTTLTTEAYYVDGVETAAGDEALKWANASKGYFDECLSGLYQQGAFVDRTLVRMAARLFDGSYVAFSPIYYVQDSDELIENIGYYWLGTYKSIGRDNRNFVSCPRIRNATNRSNFFTSVRGFIPKFTMECELSRWRDVIAAIDVFATPSIMGYESVAKELTQEKKAVNGTWTTITTQNSFERYKPKSGAKIREEVSKASLFYRIAEYDLEGKEVWRLEETSPSQLAVQKALPLNGNPHELSSGVCRYLYNNKMHLAGVTERFRDGNSVMDVPGKTAKQIVQMMQIVTIAADGGEKKVVTTTKNPLLFQKRQGEYYLTPLLHYPDARAKNIRLYAAYVNETGASTAIVRRDFPLTAHDTLNEAYYLAEASTGENYKTEITEAIDDVRVEVGTGGNGNNFLAAIKDKYTDRNDYSGTFSFVCKGSGSSLGDWDLTVKFDDRNESEAPVYGVSVLSYGLRMFVGETEITPLDELGGKYNDKFTKGDEITVRLALDNESFAGIDAIKVGGEGWVSSLPEVEETYNGQELLSFTVSNVTDDRIHTREGVMRVSEVDNPMCFPAKSTYAFDTDIVAVCSNAVAASQGQFGQHPLYVFTKSGVWLMSVDASGAGSYLSQVPCSREICSNGKGVTATAMGVVFPTKRGLMVMSGTEAVNISQGLGGLSTPELRVSGDAIERICGIVGKGYLNSRVAFVDYLADAFTAFDHRAELLYVCNGNYDYVYVYNPVSSAWSSADGCYFTTVPYPEKLIMAGSYQSGGEWKYRRYTFDRESVLTEDVPVVMVSRGCLFGATGFKRVGKSALRATVYGETMGFYMLGSVDGVKCEVIGGKECVKGMMRAAPPAKRIVRDFVCRFLRSKVYRYIAFAFAGNVRSDARLAMVECEVQTEFDKSIR